MVDFPIERYGTKADVYSTINRLREDLQLDPHLSIYAKGLFYECCPRPQIFIPDFRTNFICGILVRGKNTTSIILNGLRSEEQQNFDCAHELIHYFCHNTQMHLSAVKCILGQDSGLEYQANEGAAQLLIPDIDFIPRYLDLMNYKYSHPSFDVISYLAKHYFVSEWIIRLRIDNLGFEIDQFRMGMPVNALIHLSKKKLDENNIYPTPYLALTDFNGLNYSEDVKTWAY